MGPRRLRVFELALVVATGFLLSTFWALESLWTGEPLPAETWVTGVERTIDAALGIALLGYVLYRQGRSLGSLGLTAKLSDVGWALLIMFFTRLIQMPIGLAMAPFDPTPSPVAEPGWLVAVIPSAAKEELIVRAFLMTEVAALTGSMGVAVVASVVVQTLYHLYWGVPAALVCAGGFFVSSVFYANTRRITPVIVAHALYNFWVFAVQT